MEKTEKSFLVFDIETVDEEVLEAKRDGREPEGEEPRPFPPLHRHRIVAIGALWLSERYFFKKLGIFSEGKDEYFIVEDFNGFVSQKRPILVSFNGRRFDVPVIFLRSLKYGLSMDWHLRTQEYTRRYPPTRHLDLCDILADYGAASFTSLDHITQLLGLKGKQDMDGSKVEAEFLKGNLEKIRNYCLGDVLLTTCVFLRYLLVSGDLSPSYYNECLESCMAGIQDDARLKGFISADDIARLRIETGGDK